MADLYNAAAATGAGGVASAGYRWYLGSQVLSIVGTMMSYTALFWLALHIRLGGAPAPCRRGRGSVPANAAVRPPGRDHRGPAPRGPGRDGHPGLEAARALAILTARTATTAH